MRSSKASALSLLVSLAVATPAFAQTASAPPASTPDLSGVWARVVDAASRPFYLFAFEAAEPAMTPWGQAKYQETKPSHGARAVALEASNDPVFNGCNPPGVPRAYLHPFPIQLVNVPGHGVLILYEYDLKTGGTHRNTELITVVDGRIVEVQVFFGGAVR